MQRVHRRDVCSGSTPAVRSGIFDLNLWSGVPQIPALRRLNSHNGSYVPNPDPSICSNGLGKRRQPLVIIAATRSRSGSRRSRAPFPPTDVVASRARLAPSATRNRASCQRSALPPAARSSLLKRAAGRTKKVRETTCAGRVTAAGTLGFGPSNGGCSGGLAAQFQGSRSELHLGRGSGRAQCVRRQRRHLPCATAPLQRAVKR